MKFGGPDLQMTLQWRHNECDGVPNHRPFDCLLNRLFRCRSKKTSKQWARASVAMVLTLLPRNIPLSIRWRVTLTTLQWRQNERHGVSNDRRLVCLLNRFFRRRSKKTSKLRVTGLVRGIHRWPVDSHHKGPVTRKMFPFDAIMYL